MHFFNLNQLRELDISNNECSRSFASTCIPGVDLFKGGELETNIRVIHFIINYKIMLKAVTPL